MRRVLLVVGHGSHLDAGSSVPIRDHAARVADDGAFDEVRLGFWKEEPSLSRALDGCDADEVVVLPFFMADGYFVQQVVPRELGLEGPVTHRDGMVIRYGPPVGTHPGLTAVVEARAREAGATDADSVAVLGHGTPRNPASAAAAEQHAARLSAQSTVARAFPIYLDQEPSIASLAGKDLPGRLFIVPLFVSEGWHVGYSIPEALEEAGVRDAVLTPPVGTHPRVAGLLTAIAQETSECQP